MTPQAPAAPATSTALRNSLIAAALIPVGLIVALLAGESIAALLGYSDPEQDMPLWAILAAGLPAIAIGLIAPLSAFVLGRRARQETGRKLALVPLVIGGVAALYIVLINALAPFA